MIGRRLGPYRILDKIGAGGMGEVYRARDERLERDVALKALPPDVLGDEPARQRFRHEALALSRLNHPNICTIHDVGEAEGMTYIAMELVEGRTWSDLARARELPVDSAIRYGIQIADALAHAHERELIHRDLKGANVIITPEGRVKVLDFGLAKHLPRGAAAEATRTQGSITDAGSVVGTLHCLAPEVLRGEPADGRSDIWALGVMLHEAAAGELPFQGKSGFEVTSAILRDSPGALPPHVPPGLRAVIQRCLAKEPGRRYQRAGEVVAALEAIQSSSASIPVAVVPPKPVRFRRWPLAMAATIILLVAAGVLLRDRFLARTAGTRIESIAVLPLDNLSRDPEQEFFADGKTEELITQLSKIGSLKVISRTSVMPYRGTKKSLPAIARELQVDAVVEGSVRRAGDRVRITAQLIHASSDKHLWAESYERDLRDVLALESEVAQTIARQIQATLTPQEKTRLAASRPVDPEVYQLCLKGRSLTASGLETDQRNALDLFEQAAAKDPNYAPAHVGLASIYFQMSSNYLAPLEAMPKAKAAAVRAIELDDSLADAHSALGAVKLLYDWDWPGAEKELRRAIEINPSLADARMWYGLYFTAMKRHAESAAEMKRAVELDPLSAIVQFNAGFALFMAREYDSAIVSSRKAIQLDPNNAFAHGIGGLALAPKGSFPEGIAELKKATEMDSSSILALFLASGYAAAAEKRKV